MNRSSVFRHTFGGGQNAVVETATAPQKRSSLRKGTLLVTPGTNFVKQAKGRATLQSQFNGSVVCFQLQQGKATHKALRRSIAVSVQKSRLPLQK